MRFALSALLFSCSWFSSSLAQTVSLERIFKKPYIAGSRPSVAALSPDGERLLFQWDSSARGENKLWIVPTGGGTIRQVLDSAVSSCAWSPDGKRIAFVQKGDVFLTDPSFKQQIRLTRTPAGEGQLLWSPDSKFLSVTTNNIFVFSTTQPGAYQITNNSNEVVSYSAIEFSPDNKRVLFAEYDQSGLPEFMVPQYVGTEVSARKFKSGFSKVRLGIARVDTGKTVWLKSMPDRFLPGSIQFSPDGRKVLVDLCDTTRKTRWLALSDTDSGATKVVYTEFDSTWIESGIYSAQWSRDGKSIYFLSERDGWNHIYQMWKDSSDVRQLTVGEWEVKWFDQHYSDGTLFFTANKEERSQWQLYALDVKKWTTQKLSLQAGTYSSPTLAFKGDALVCSYSNFDVPSELYSFVDDKQRRLTNSITKEFQSLQWIRPQVVQFKARDGKIVHAMLYKPKELRPDKYPCVVFVHGAGYLQNIFRGWSGYYREYMFNNYLVSKGYVVFELDYRGSAGYGRDFRRDVYMYLGGKDLDDELDGVEYLKGLGYIDSTRIGLYGGSYGGFLPLMALFKSPSTYACAAVLRAVTSWENYYRHNPWYTLGRLGTPDSNKEAYARSSPITFADSLTKPLLILHGMVDDNVFFQDAVQLVNKLQKSGKKFELMMYPAEAHGFTQPESWFDEYRRINEFFEEHLLLK